MNNIFKSAVLSVFLSGYFASGVAQERQVPEAIAVGRDEVRRFEVHQAREELRKHLGRLDPRELADAISRAREHSAGLTELPRQSRIRT